MFTWVRKWALHWAKWIQSTLSHKTHSNIILKFKFFDRRFIIMFTWVRKWALHWAKWIQSTLWHKNHSNIILKFKFFDRNFIIMFTWVPKWALHGAKCIQSTLSHKFHSNINLKFISCCHASVGLTVNPLQLCRPYFEDKEVTGHEQKEYIQNLKGTPTQIHKDR